MRRSGLEIRIFNCHAAAFASPGGARFTDRLLDEIVIEHGDRRGELAVRQLFTRRWLTVHPGSRLRPGDRATLAWHPATDVWEGSGLSDIDSHPHAPVVACRWLRRCLANVGPGAPAPEIVMVE